MDILIFGGCFAIIAIASRQIGQNLMKTGLPLISGFLFTGILTGPYGLNLITQEATENLRFVDEISLGFIAFAAGGELYVKEIKDRLKSIAWITSGLVLFTFALTSLAFFLLSGFIGFMDGMPLAARIAVSILAGAILVARSPSSAIAIVNELRAKGPFTQTVLGVTIIMDVVVILLFSANSSVADALLSGLTFNFGFVLLLLAEIVVSLLVGWLVFRLIFTALLLPTRQTVKTVLVLLSGFLVFSFSAQVRHLSHDILGIEILLEPLLICMVAGFLTANISRFRTEFLKLLHDIGPTIYIAFFTLTGASLSLDVLARTWPIALALFGVRVGAIFLGTFAGGTLANNSVKSNSISWMAFITQAGVGLGLAKEVVVAFPEWGNPFATIIISVIVINQLVGPPLFKLAIKLMKEDHSRAAPADGQGGKKVVIFGADGQASALALSLLSQGWQVVLAATRHSPKGVQSDYPSNLTVHEISDVTLERLRQIDCHNAAAIVTLLSDDENFVICEAAYEHFGTQTIIARLNDRDNFGCFQALGVLIVDPSTAIVSLLDHFVRSPATASLFLGMHQNRKVTDLRMMNPDLAGLALRDVRLPLDALIMSVRRRGVLFMPHGYTRLEVGDFVTVIGSQESVREIALRFGINREAALLDLVHKVKAPDLQGGEAPKEGREKLARPATGDRFDQLVEQGLVLDIKSPMDKTTFFDMVAHAMSDTLKMSSNSLYELLVQREEEMTTVMAPGIAIPHVIIEGEQRIAILLARCKAGIEFAQGKPPVHAAFVLAGTRDERNFHLQALSAIAQIVLDPRFERKWMRAKNRAALKAVIADAERKRQVAS